jgi:hypothetical protein
VSRHVITPASLRAETRSKVADCAMDLITRALASAPRQQPSTKTMNFSSSADYPLDWVLPNLPGTRSSPSGAVGIPAHVDSRLL